MQRPSKGHRAQNGPFRYSNKNLDRMKFFCISYLMQLNRKLHIKTHKISLDQDSFVEQLNGLLSTWAVGDCCVSLKMLKSPHEEIYSFKPTMLWLSLSSSLSLPKYFNQYDTMTGAYSAPPCYIDSTHAHVVLGRSQSILVFTFGDFPETQIEAQCRINATWRQRQ